MADSPQDEGEEREYFYYGVHTIEAIKDYDVSDVAISTPSLFEVFVKEHYNRTFMITIENRFVTTEYYEDGNLNTRWFTLDTEHQINLNWAVSAVIQDSGDLTLTWKQTYGWEGTVTYEHTVEGLFVHFQRFPSFDDLYDLP